MLSGAEQKRVWEGMLESEIRSNYFAELAGRYSKRQQFGTWATLLFSSSDVVSLLAYFGMSADFWMNMQSAYELDLARQQNGKVIGRIPKRSEMAEPQPKRA